MDREKQKEIDQKWSENRQKRFEIAVQMDHRRTENVPKITQIYAK